MQFKDMINDFFEFKKDNIAIQAFVPVALGFNWFLGQTSLFVQGVFFKGGLISESFSLSQFGSNFPKNVPNNDS